MSFDLDDPIPVLEDIYWVGFSEESSKLHCNPYLLVDEGEAVILDPGSIPDFARVMRKVIEVVQPERISTMVLSHQDPDVCGNIAVMEEIIGSDEIRIAAHINTIRLVQHIGVRSPFYDVEKSDWKLTLRSGRALQFIPAPFLHSPGSIMTFDSRTGTLFSGDIFGGISNTWTLFAEEGYLEAMQTFHQAYMPSNAILRECMERVERMDIQRILPQHGSVISREQVPEAINFLKELPCAFDLHAGIP